MLRRLATMALVLASATSALTGLLHAQPPSQPAAGQRVRIHLTADPPRAEGWVARWVDDTLHLRQLVYRGSPDSLRFIPRAHIASYQTSLGRDEGRGLRRGARTGALIGGGIGLTLLLLGAAADSGCQDYCFGTAIGAVFGAGTTLAGILLGSTIGLLAAPERWSEPQPVR